MNRLVAMVKDFHRAYNLPAPETPATQVPLKLYLLRQALHKEEMKELEHEVGGNDVAALVKEAVDVMYVAIGTLVALGVDAEHAFEVVHKSNMSKLGPDGYPIYRHDGKVLKGPNYQPVDPDELLGVTNSTIVEE